MNAVRNHIDERSDFSGRTFTTSQLRQRLEQMSFGEACHLRPDNLSTIVQDAGMSRYAQEFFGRSLLEQQTALALVLTNLEKYPSGPIKAATRTPRHYCVPARAAPLAYWNGANVVRGTIAVPAPWLAAYLSMRLQVDRGARVLVFGFGYGYCSLVFANLIGPDGHLTAIETDENRVKSGRNLLDSLGYGNVSIVHGNALSVSKSLGRFDSIWASLSTVTVPPVWFDLLAAKGKLGVFLPSKLPSNKARKSGINKEHESKHGIMPGSNWWGNVSLMIFNQDSGISCEREMPRLVNPPFEALNQGRLESDAHYPGLEEYERRLLRFVSDAMG